MQGAGGEGDFCILGLDDEGDFQQDILPDFVKLYPVNGFGESVDKEVQR